MASNPTSTAWLAHYKPNPQARLRLFCFPYAGGGASIFREWSDILPVEVEVCPVQLPGRENRVGEPLFKRLTALIQALAQALGPHLIPPFAFFGHSMGALISFELSRELRRRNESGPVYLFISGCRASQLPDPKSPIHQLPEPEFINELRRLKGTPEAVLIHPELMQLMLPLLRADFAVSETYIHMPEIPLNSPISVFGGWHDPEVNRDQLMAWRDQTRGAFNLRMLPGDHFFLHSAQWLLLRAMSVDLLRLLNSLISL